MREDPQRQGLLFAGTEFGIYVSFDDGEHWQSLQLNLPVTAVHDLVIHGDDLVIATHGRSFWILDDITPLRQTGDAMKADGAWLYRPATAVRIDNDKFLGTPLPPEEPTAENPPNGAILDHCLKTAANQVKIEIFDAKQNLVRSFSSEDSTQLKGPPLPVAERWLPKPQVVDKTAGMHRFVWDLSWGSSGSREVDVADEDEHSVPRSPRAVPGAYQVRLTVDGKTWTQPLNIAMDPRSEATPRELEQQFRLAMQIFAEAVLSRQALSEIRSVRKQLSALEPRLNAADLKGSVSQVEAEIGGILKGSGSSSGGAIGLETASTGLASALRVVEGGDRAVPSQAIALYQESSQAAKLRIADWNELKTSRLEQVNQQLRQANLTPIATVQIELDEEGGASR